MCATVSGNTTPENPPSEGKGERPSLKHVASLLAVGVVALIPGLGSSPPWLKAEERVVEVTQGMLRTGDVLIPRLDGQPHLTKPPLVYWMGYLAGRALHRDDMWAIRLPSALSAIACMALVYLLGCRMKSRAVGLLSALVLMSCALFDERARIATFDAPLTAATLLGLYGAWGWIESRSRRDAFLLFAGSVLGFMVKGPVAWLFIGVGLIGGLAVRGELKRLAAWRAAAFLVLLLACSTGWFLCAMASEPLARKTFAEEMALPFGQMAEDHTAKHFEPFYAYAQSLPLNLLPWTVYLPAAGLYLWRRRRAPRQSPLWFAIVPAGVCFLILSLIPAKQGAYLLPVYPAIAVFIAWLLDGALREGSPREAAWLRRTNMAVGLAGVLAGAVVAVLFWMRAGAPVWACAVVGAALAAAGAMMIALARKGKNRQAVYCLFAAWFLFAPVVNIYYMPKHRSLHMRKDSPERKAYEEREKRLRGLFGLG